MMMHQKPTVCIPQWSSLLDIYSSSSSSSSDAVFDGDFDFVDDDIDDLNSLDAYSSDEFRMYEFKIRRCARGRSHDWTECPFAHPGEKARRRDPRKFLYSGSACPEFRKGCCKKGDACEMSHGVFECWLHPARYRTQPCKDGTACRRRVCFFAHTPEQLRVLPQSPKTVLESYDGSPMRHNPLLMMNHTATSTASGSSSPPMSPTDLGEFGVFGDVMSSMRKLQLGKMKSMSVRGFGSPRGLIGGTGGFCSLPTTPTRGFDHHEEGVERVESGRALRAKMYERLSKESGMERAEPSSGPGPDVGWVSELLM